MSGTALGRKPKPSVSERVLTDRLPDQAVRLSRRSWLSGSAGAAAGLLANTASKASGPLIHIKRPWRLRVLGTHVTLQEVLRRQAQADLGIEIEFSPGGSAAVLHQASTRPESFDLYEQWSNSIRVLWQAGTIAPIDTQRLTYWDEINQLTKDGKLTPQARIGRGDAPNKLLHVQQDGSLGHSETTQISFLPYVHNVDSFGYDASVVDRGEAYKTESWSWLLDERWAGKVAVVNEPTIGLFDLALAAQAKGLIEFRDIGDMDRSEIDRLFEILMRYRRSGHFRGTWSSVPASVRLMQRREACLESMFSPAVFALRGHDVDCVYASPREGYRAGTV